MSPRVSSPLPAAAIPVANLTPALVSLVDALPWALWLLDAQGRLRHANRVARAVLAAGGPLRLNARHRLQPAAATARAAFAAALQSAAVGKPQVLHWPGRGGDRAATLRALAPLPDGASLLMLAMDTGLGSTAGAQAYAQAKGLTPRESSVLESLAQGRNPTAVAAQLGIKPGAVRSRILTLRRKTGHAGLVELLSDLGRLPPLLSDP